MAVKTDQDTPLIPSTVVNQFAFLPMHKNAKSPLANMNMEYTVQKGQKERYELYQAQLTPAPTA
jgi:hypothetical protein